MSAADEPMTRAGLIQLSLSGKATAISAYDEMLWKIRTGYAAVLYGAFTLVVSLVDKQKLQLPADRAGAVAIILVTGFTIAASALDFSILRSKLRVVQAKEELSDLALFLASGGAFDQWKGTALSELLHNSGEDRVPVRWSARPSVIPVVMLYLGTWCPLVIAVLLLMA